MGDQSGSKSGSKSVSKLSASTECSNSTYTDGTPITCLDSFLFIRPKAKRSCDITLFNWSILPNFHPSYFPGSTLNIFARMLVDQSAFAVFKMLAPTFLGSLMRIAAPSLEQHVARAKRSKS